MVSGASDSGRPEVGRPQPADPPPAGGEPAFNAPWPALALTLAILSAYLVQSLAGEPEQILTRYGFSPPELAQGRYAGLLTALFVHGSWTHAFLNALGALAFGAPVARFLGLGPRGIVAFFVFYMGTGIFSGLGFAALHPVAAVLLVGASGAVAGLMGAASRLIDRRAAAANGGLAPFSNRTVVAMAVAWIAINALAAVFGFGVVTGDQPIAWEAHLFGYAAGLAWIAPAGRLAGAFRAHA